MKKIAIIKTKWNTDFVNNAADACSKRLNELGVSSESMNTFIVPGAVEMPLLAKKLIKDNAYDAVIAIAVIYRGGIYRHDFVASSVVNEIIRLNSELEKPIFSSVLTPDTDHFSNPEKQEFYLEHLKTKGIEVADACIETLSLHDSLM